MDTWIDVCAADEVPEGGTWLVQAQGERICLYEFQGALFATHDRCTHASASLADGFITEDGAIECPIHMGLFDIRTGKALTAPCTVDLRTYPVRVVAGRVQVQV
jgi:anthranilate 1,2-dioxygenase ferredoxin component